MIYLMHPVEHLLRRAVVVHRRCDDVVAASRSSASVVPCTTATTAGGHDFVGFLQKLEQIFTVIAHLGRGRREHESCCNYTWRGLISLFQVQRGVTTHALRAFSRARH